MGSHLGGQGAGCRAVHVGVEPAVGQFAQGCGEVWLPELVARRSAGRAVWVEPISEERPRSGLVADEQIKIHPLHKRAEPVDLEAVLGERDGRGDDVLPGQAS